MRELFLLDPDVVFLNHGSFGACPRPVLDAYQAWQRELERQPVEFLGRRSAAYLEHARQQLASYLHADAENLVYITNTTAGVNTIARSLSLGAGDEVVTTDHEYGACDHLWELVCRRSGARYRRVPLPFPTPSAETITDLIWHEVTDRTRVLYLSHVTSTTALILPVGALCRRARARGILSVIDGAHVPGHVPLDLATLDADVYVGNCHKWLCAPKGSAFLHVRAEYHEAFDPAVMSWGCVGCVTGHTGLDGYVGSTPLVRRHQWQGTRDISAFLAVPAAIDFQREHRWDHVRRRCHELARDVRDRIQALTGLASVCPDDMFGQMVAIELPACDASALQAELWGRFRIEVPVTAHAGRNFLRVSVQGYNTERDLDALVAAMRVLLSESGGVFSARGRWRVP